MKGSQRKQKALVVTIFATCMVGLLTSWLNNDDAAVPTSSGTRISYLRKQEPYSNSLRTPLSQPDTLPLSREPTYPTVVQENHAYVIEEVYDPAIKHEFLPSPSDSRNVDYRAKGVDQLSARSTSDSRQIFTQLINEIVAQTHDETEAVLQIGGLALSHPEPQVRELAVAFLAEIGNDLAINFLIDALVDTDLNIRKLAVNSLYRLGNRVPIKPLVELILNSRDAALRADVLAFVRRFSDPESLIQIEAHLQGGS